MRNETNTGGVLCGTPLGTDTKGGQEFAFFEDFRIFFFENVLSFGDCSELQLLKHSSSFYDTDVIDCLEHSSKKFYFIPEVFYQLEAELTWEIDECRSQTLTFSVSSTTLPLCVCAVDDKKR